LKRGTGCDKIERKLEFTAGSEAVKNCEIDIAEICGKLKTLDFVTDVSVTGSRIEGCADPYSDIDLIVDIQRLQPDAALLEITEFMNMTYSPLWFDYANSLMPSKFLVSMFIDCENPFCFLDIGIFNKEEDLAYDPEKFKNDKWVHLTKLWIMNFKYYLRNDKCFPRRFKSMIKQADISGCDNEFEGFEKLLELLSAQKVVNNTYLDMLYKAVSQAGTRSPAL